MKEWLIPRGLMPHFTWSNNARPISNDQMPSTPRLTHIQLRRFWGVLHKPIRRFSRTYCGWAGITYDNQIAQFPFGLILKWSDSTQIWRGFGHASRPQCRPTGSKSDLLWRASRYTPRTGLDSHGSPTWRRIRPSVRDTEQRGKTADFARVEKIHGGNSEMVQSAGRDKNLLTHWHGHKKRLCSLPFRRPFESEQESHDHLLSPSWSGGFASETDYENARTC